ncbi:hypothetical protein JTE90_006759 [Oedothorax gibbosus]|uniref:Uncharacterized protein n=1 Tax=Oedothorax gibbosus TaxID=931172 RepID=A0AAV6UJG2_9ARAC|nr:hypothetical protein JTE90_006759 [Oedothorax gibbosus]
MWRVRPHTKRCISQTSKFMVCGEAAHESTAKCPNKPNCISCSTSNKKNGGSMPTDHKTGYFRCPNSVDNIVSPAREQGSTP